MKFSPRVWGFLVLGLAVSSSQLGAQNQVRFAGATYGCFYDTPATTCLPASPVTDMFLTFTQGTFDALTSPTGFLGLGGPTNNLGTMTLGTGTATYTGKFLLDVVFALPSVTSSTSLFTAALVGDVFRGDGGVDISFQDSPQTFNFDGPDYSGQFTLTVNDVSLNPNNGPQV
ncbi:MAG: hypothetical protein ACREPM_07600, partial [Gemmatimonadaceae bacterium]